MNCKRKSVRILLVAAAAVAVLLVLAGRGHAGLAVSPAYVDVRLDKANPAGTFVLRNTGDTEERYRINSVHWVTSPNGGFALMPPTQDTLSAWVKFNPKEITLPPKSHRTVRFVIVPRGKLREGEYWAGMELESLNVNTSRMTNDKGSTFEVKAVTSILVPIFGANGKVFHAAEPNGVEIMTRPEGRSLALKIRNSGTGHLTLRGTYSVTDAAGKVVQEGPFAGGYILPDTETMAVVPLGPEIPAGTYTVHVDYQPPQIEQGIADQGTVTLGM
jgi:P pilus assembly chaperone PapD